MRFIPTKIHGILDYLVGALLIAAPWLFNFANGGAQQWLPVALGAVGIVYTLFTDHELGVFRTLSMPTHLLLDLLSGILLAASPWLFGFADEVYLPHLVLGLLEVSASLTTKRTSIRTRRCPYICRNPVEATIFCRNFYLTRVYSLLRTFPGKRSAWDEYPRHASQPACIHLEIRENTM
ncbi:MAG: SPW repeat protein [Chitinophagaceae bacterium]